MDNLHEIMDRYFRYLSNYGYLNNNETYKITALALIDDYYLDMTNSDMCSNASHNRLVLNRLINNILDSSCILSM